MRNRLLLSTALGATYLAAGLAVFPAMAANDCGVAAPMTTVTCNAGTETPAGAFADADGITYAVSDLTIVFDAMTTAEHINSGGGGNFGNLTITSNGTINQTAVSAGNAQAGLAVRSNNGNMTVTNTGDITTISNNVEGILAYTTVGYGAVDITSSGNIVTSGTQAHGIRARTYYGMVTVDHSGDITVNSTAHGIYTRTYSTIVDIDHSGTITGTSAVANMNGIRAVNTGLSTTTINVSGDITMASGLGVFVSSAGGPVSTTISGTITTTGGSGRGVSIAAATGNSTATITGEIVSSGAGVDGFNMTSTTGNATLMLDGDISTTGNNAYGARVSAGLNAMVTVTADALVTTVGNDSDALIVAGAASAGANVNVAGTLHTEGSLARPVLVNVSNQADVTFSGDVMSTGASAAGILVQAGEDIVFTMTGGVVQTSGMGSYGVRLLSQSGDVTANLQGGSITTLNDDAAGFVLTALNGPGLNMLTSQVSIATSGTESDGILSLTGEGGLMLTAGGSVVTTGNASHGVRTVGAFIALPGINPDGNQTVSVTGGIRTSGLAAHGVLNESVYGSISTTVAMGASIDTGGTGSNGIDMTSTMGGNLTAAVAGQVTAANIVFRSTTDGSTTFDNDGMLASDVDFLVDAKGGGAFTGTNGGMMTGFVNLTAQGDFLTNEGAGTWILQDRATMEALSDFGMGDDRLLNNGLMTLGDWLMGPEMARFAGLELFEHGGELALFDGEAGDSVAFDGNFAGLGGSVTLDTVLEGDASPTDRLSIGGNATGTTALVVNNLGGGGAATDDGILLVDVGGTSDTSAFFLAGGPIAQGSFVYDLFEANEDWFLTSALRPELLLAAEAGHVALGAWRAGLGTLDERLGEIRHLLPAGTPQTAALGVDDGQQAFLPSATAMPVGLWAKVALDRLEMSPSGGSSFDQRNFVGQFGADLGFRDALGGEDLLLLGLMAGLVSAEAEADATDASQNLEGWSVGLYGTYLWEGLHLDFVAKLDSFEIEHSAPSIGFSATQDALVYGASLEAGYRFDLDGSFFLEPQAQIAYARADLEDIPLLGDDSAEFEDAESLWLRVGGRAGTSFRLAGARFQPYLEAAYVHEFLGEANATLAATSLESSLEGGGFEAGGGLAVTGLGEHFSLHIDANYLTGDRVEGLQLVVGGRVTW